MTDYPPDFTNADGVRWWLDSLSTDYAQDKGLSLKVYRVELLTGERAFVVVEGQRVVHECKTLEEVGCWLDMAALEMEGR